MHVGTNPQNVLKYEGAEQFVILNILISPRALIQMHGIILVINRQCMTVDKGQRNFFLSIYLIKSKEIQTIFADE